MTTKFRAYGEDELPNLDFRATKDDAFMVAVSRLTAELGTDPHKPTIIIEEVRDPKLSDFFEFNDLISAMRERMSERIGNDDALTDDNITSLAASAMTSIKVSLDLASETTDLRIDGYLVVNKWRMERWWVKDPGNSDE